MLLIVWPQRSDTHSVCTPKLLYICITLLRHGAINCDVLLYFAGLGCGTLAVLEQNEAGIALLRR